MRSSAARRTPTPGILLPAFCEGSPARKRPACRISSPAFRKGSPSRRRPARRVLWLLLFLLPLLLSGCGASGNQTAEEAAVPVIIGDMTFNAENGESDIDPHKEYGGWACIRYGVGETLIRFSDAMEPEPWLAESWENIDPLTWQIRLREGVRFHSGKALDAEAVRSCLLRLTERLDRAAADLQIDHMEADGLKLTIVTKVPRPVLINSLGDPYACIIDVEASVPEGLVSGTGPFIPSECVTGDHLTLQKNPDYWGGEVLTDRLTIRTIADGNTLAASLQAGEIDAAYGIPYGAYPLFENDRYSISRIATSRSIFCRLNFRSPVIRDPAVRQALSLGIDRRGFVNALLDGNGYAAWGAFPESFRFGQQNLPEALFDPEGAKEILEEAGWRDTDGDGIREKDGVPLRVRWLTYPSRSELPLLAETAQYSLQQIGFDVEVISTADHRTLVKNDQAWEIYASAQVNAPTGDPDFFFTSCCLDASAGNYGHFHSDRLEELAARLAEEFDPEKRAALAVEMQQVLLEENGVIFCSFLQMAQISKSSLSAYTAHTCDYYQVTPALEIR